MPYHCLSGLAQIVKAETYVTTPGLRFSSLTSWSYFAIPKIASTSSGETDGSYDLASAAVEYWTALVRQTLPSSRSNDRTPAYPLANDVSEFEWTYLLSIVQDHT